MLYFTSVRGWRSPGFWGRQGLWIPAFAGMTGVAAGMTGVAAGMTAGVGRDII